MAMDLMVDLETVGVNPGCIILAIGASSFDQRHTFYEKICVSNSLDVGLKAEQATQDWWQKQSEAARNEAHSGTKEVIQVLGEFATFCNRLPEEFYIWGNGADFDLPILAAAYRQVGMKVPWKPFNGRCYRTLKNLYKDVKLERVGMHHNALDDAKSQANHAYEILKKHFNK